MSVLSDWVPMCVHDHHQLGSLRASLCTDWYKKARIYLFPLLWISLDGTWPAPLISVTRCLLLVSHSFIHSFILWDDDDQKTIGIRYLYIEQIVRLTDSLETDRLSGWLMGKWESGWGNLEINSGQPEKCEEQRAHTKYDFDIINMAPRHTQHLRFRIVAFVENVLLIITNTFWPPELLI